MAIFNWHIESYRKGGATSQSDYVWGRSYWSEREDIVATGCGNLPQWSGGDPGVFFAAADEYERQNGSACRHLVVALPRELDLTAWVRLVEKLISQDLGPKPYQYAIHVKREGEKEHPHAHIVYSDRVPDGVDRTPEKFFRRANTQQQELGGCKKDSGGRSPKRMTIGIVGRKKLWEDLQNDALAAAGHAVRVDHRSCKGQRI